MHTSISLMGQNIDVNKVDSFLNINNSVQIFLDHPQFEKPENIHLDSFVNYERLSLQERYFPLYSKRIWLKYTLKNTSTTKQKCHLYFGRLDRILVFHKRSNELELVDKKGLAFKNYNRNEILSSYFIPISLDADSEETFLVQISPSSFYYFDSYLDINLVKSGYEFHFTNEKLYPTPIGPLFIIFCSVVLFISILFSILYFIFRQLNLLAFSLVGLSNLLMLTLQLEYYYEQPIFWGFGDDLLMKPMLLIKALIIISIYFFIFTTFSFRKKYKSLVILAVLNGIVLISTGILVWYYTDTFIYPGDYTPFIFLLDGTGTCFNIYLGILIWIQNGRNGKYFISSAIFFLCVGYLGNIRLVFPSLLNTYFLPSEYGFLTFYCLLIYLLISNLILDRKRIIEEAIIGKEYKAIDKLKSKLYTNITHELRTPLTVISGLSNHLDDSQEKLLIQKNSSSLLNLVTKILDVSKLESGMLQLHETDIELVSYLGSLIDSVSPLAKEKKILLNYNVNLKTLDVSIDIEKLKMIFINVLTNAIKYTLESGKITATLQHIENDIIIRISDTGVGISPSEIDKIFDRYYKVNESTSFGSGIGLSLVKELVVLMDGSIQVESHLNKGTTFNIVLPYKQVIPERTELFTSYKYPHGKSDTILIVEDNRDLIFYITQIIKPFFNILIAERGEEGLEIAKQEIPDIIISDIMMPGMDGFELTKHLKSDSLTAHIPIIVLTAKADNESKIKGFEYEIDSYLTKPFIEQELLNRINSILRNREKIQSHLLSELNNDNTSDAGIDPFMKNVIESIKENIDNDMLDVNRLSSILNVHKSQLYRKIRSLTSKTPLELILEMRMNKAKELLKDPNIRVNEVAYACGFSDSNYFSKVFKKQFEITPTDYIKSQRS